MFCRIVIDEESSLIKLTPGRQSFPDPQKEPSLESCMHIVVDIRRVDQTFRNTVVAEDPASVWFRSSLTSATSWGMSTVTP